MAANSFGPEEFKLEEKRVKGLTSLGDEFFPLMLFAKMLYLFSDSINLEIRPESRHNAPKSLQRYDSNGKDYCLKTEQMGPHQTSKVFCIAKETWPKTQRQLSWRKYLLLTHQVKDCYLGYTKYSQRLIPQI